MSRTDGDIAACTGVYGERIPREGNSHYINLQRNDEDKHVYIEPVQSGENWGKKQSGAKYTYKGDIDSIEKLNQDQYSSRDHVKLPLNPDDPVPDKTFRSKRGSIYSKPNEIQYAVEETPPWYLCLILGFQHYLVMFGATFFNPVVLADSLCIASDDALTKSQLMGTIFVCSGIATLLQTTFGVRLPIIQGGTFTFVTPSLAILSLPHWKCPEAATPAPPMDVTMATTYSVISNETTANFIDNDEPLWKPRIREIQGAIIVASLFQVVIGFTGIMGFFLKWIGPLAVAPTIALAGLALFEVATVNASKQWWIALVTVVLISTFSQYTKNIAIPCFRFKRGQGCIKVNFPLFRLLPIILAVGITWMLCLILTMSGVFSDDPSKPGYGANTYSRFEMFKAAPWFRVPYPGQWGTPTVSTAAVFGMLAGVMASMAENAGDYYACARIAQVQPPPMHAVNRGLGMNGMGCVIAGLFGSGSGTTSYSENIGAIGITKVASRRVAQVAGIIMIVMGVFSKFGALFVTIPDPITGGVFIVMFGMIAAVGISNLQFVDLNSTRNLFIIGFTFFFGLALPKYVKENASEFKTGVDVLDSIIFVLLSTNMFVGGLAGFVLDNTIPGTEEERGLIKWRSHITKKKKKKQKSRKTERESEGVNVYEVPFLPKIVRQWQWSRFVPFLPTFDEELLTLKSAHEKRRKRNAPDQSAERHDAA